MHAAAAAAVGTAAPLPSVPPHPQLCGHLPARGVLSYPWSSGVSRGLSGMSRLQLPPPCHPLQLLLWLCQTGNAAAERRFLPLLPARPRGAGARLVEGFGLSWDPKVSSFCPGRASSYLLGYLPLSGSDRRRLSVSSWSCCWWHPGTESPQAALG